MNRRRFLKTSVRAILGSALGTGPVRWVSARPSPVPKIALIIDDIGYSRSRTDLFLSLGIPVTFSILPRLALSRNLAGRIHDAGHEIMLHQPMEPLSRQFDPGPGALYMTQDSEEIAETVSENIAATPHIAGVNNHMGSRFTACCDKIDSALRVVRDRALYFVDSRTSERSMAFETACRLHLPSAQRHVFLDNRRTVGAVLTQLGHVERRAVIHGAAVAIGHPFPETAQALKIWSGRLPASGIDLIHVSKLLNHQ
jgi:uncharacterized protein